MRILVDESVSKAVTLYLRSMGHNVLAVVEAAPQSTDRDILAWAVQEKRIVITIDKDFGELVFRSGQAHEGIILLRLKDDSAIAQVNTLTTLLTNHANELAGQFVVVTERGLRTRSLEVQD